MYSLSKEVYEEREHGGLHADYRLPSHTRFMLLISRVFDHFSVRFLFFGPAYTGSRQWSSQSIFINQVCCNFTIVSEI
jgi:hypothetical protein